MSKLSTSPLVSVILCTYNGQAFLSEQLSSLENQTYTNIEFICSDNNSTDSTGQILKAWCDKSLARHFYTCSEKGLNKNFFGATEKASGDYIIFCDQDDIWLENKLMDLVTFHEQHPEATMVYALSKKFYDLFPTDVQVKKEANYLEGTEIKKTMLISFTLGHNILIKKEVLHKIPVPQNEMIAYDWWITVSAMCIGPIKCLTATLTYWRQHSSNTTTKNNEGLFYLSRIAYLQQFMNNDLILSKDKEWIQKAIARFSILHTHNRSFKLCLFLLSNARHIFFYKTKKNPILKWISFLKWSIRMSSQNYKSA